MWPYFPELLETPVPRYTSYPTAADFGPIETVSLAQAIAGASGDISLYLHIPFCEKICYYCGCNTGAANKRLRVMSYLAALHNEIETVASLLPRDARVRRVAFGGGSPNAIRAREFVDLVDAIHRNFWLEETEWSIELDPRSFDSVFASAIENAGITRASMGVQTFSAHCQEAIGRVQGDALICRSIDMLRSAGVKSLNFDLMYGLPKQTEEDLADSLSYTRLLGADRIAVFGYAHVPHLVPRQKMIDPNALPGSKERFNMAAQAYDYLVSHGYEAVGFDHFALPHDSMAKAARDGTLWRNFQGFTDDQSEVLIGLGASSISGFSGLLAQNEKNSGGYRTMASQGRLTASHGIVRTSEDQLRGRIITELLCQGKSQLSPCLRAKHKGSLEPFVSRGLAVLEECELTILPDGLPYARVMALLFDSFRHSTAKAISSAI
ncbi:oxygen-independent coproporphyrinogen III oxidase [uncultured Erythrobacter sp.]|uniref:oxygen-independent coproporphyrinogen III oxidase n=1 Tax=uncultured Erythrobacter sp. TaxID=263913 RepID=UPI0026391629|nr:oxygen-independent coproporphyrinogen III oxidase [uncultured Erythrobacter sp.]